MLPSDEKKIGAWRISGVGTRIGVKGHLMAPFGRQHRGPLAEGIGIRGSQVTAGHGIIVDLDRPFPDNNFLSCRDW